MNTPRIHASALAIICLWSVAIATSPAHAGGPEFPGGGTRSLGRGGASLARADDPTLMTRNPALLADLWDNQALLGANLLLVDACLRPSGGHRIGLNGQDVFRLGDTYLSRGLPPGSTLLDGTPIIDITDEPYPTVCYEGPAPFLPHVALTMKPSSDFGVGLGFFPPDNAALNQVGNRDGTVDTADGPRLHTLNPFRTHLNTSYFSLLAAAGYRINDFIRIGIGVQWQLVVFQSRAITSAVSLGALGPDTTVQTDILGRDLFVPGAVASVHLKPLDALDVAVSFKWSDRIGARANLDVTTSGFAPGHVEYIDGRTQMPTATRFSHLPAVISDQTVDVNAPPIYVPQLALGLRFADRLVPRVRDSEWAGAVRAARGETQDSMQTERWDLEVDVIYYFSSVQDRTTAGVDDVSIDLRLLNRMGAEDPPFQTFVGDCFPANANGNCEQRRARFAVGGTDQLTARVGGDYNILPGILSVRGGASYEAGGQPRSLRVPFLYMGARLGLHAGLTLRIAGKTDLSFAYAHFFQESTRLQINPQTAEAGRYTTDMGDETMAFRDRYHVHPGAHDGYAQVEVQRPEPMPGPYYVNAGTQRYDLSVLSASIAQHF